MDRIAQYTGKDIVGSIIVLLFSLARAADRAARMPYPLRRILLIILRCAESAGRRVVTVEACYAGAAPWLMSQAQVHQGNRAIHAFDLAICLRLLARALIATRRLARRYGYSPLVRHSPHIAERGSAGHTAHRPPQPHGIDSS